MIKDARFATTIVAKLTIQSRLAKSIFPRRAIQKIQHSAIGAKVSAMSKYIPREHPPISAGSTKTTTGYVHAVSQNPNHSFR